MRLTLLSAALLASGVASAAAPIDGLYGEVFGGFTYIPDIVSNTTFGVLRDGTNYREGYNVGGRFGYKSNPLRYEAELTYLHADAKHFNVNNIPQVNVSGDATALMAMANIYYDFPEMVPCIAPFVGVGLGYAHVESRLFSEGPFGATAFKASDNVFAYQGTAGFTYNFNEFWAANLAYRYAATEQADNLGKVFQAHIANAGVVYRFDAGNYK